MRAYRSLGRFDVREPFRPWLLRIVTNLAINSRRSAGRRDAMAKRFEQRAPAAGGSPEEAAVSSEQAQRVWQAVATLEPRDQALLYLRYFLDASETEAAQAIGRPAGTVKSRLHRALRKLRGVIHDEYPDLLPERSRTKA